VVVPPGTGPPPGPDGPADGGTGDEPAVRLTGVEAVKVHATLVAALLLCVVAFWFELGRALGGNDLSWAYVFEWPLFAVFGVYMWWSILHGGQHKRRRTRRGRVAAPAVDPKYAGMLEAWQTHQRELQAAQAEAEGREPPGASTPGA